MSFNFCHQPVSIRFLQEKPSFLGVSNDLVETALVRAVKDGKSIVLDCQKVPFTAGSYFVCGQHVPLRNIEKTYVQQEHAFSGRLALMRFLHILGRNPKSRSFLSFDPGVHPDADCIVLLVSPSDAGRVLGLLAYEGHFEIDCISAAPTCAALFRPLLRPNAIHVNFIDYFDRDIQARGFFEPQELLLSMTYKLYCTLEKIHKQSSYGAYVPSGILIHSVMPPSWPID